MLKQLARNIRGYKKQTILTPIFVMFEVVLECAIPFIIALLVNSIKRGAGMSEILKYGTILTVMALLSLAFGAVAGLTCATASSGFARNLRRSIFHRVQDYSFENIDKFSTSSLELLLFIVLSYKGLYDTHTLDIFLN